MNEKECEICTKFYKEKYKHYKTWKVLAIVFILLSVTFMLFSVTFAVLYFTSGNLITTRIVEYDNEVSIENDGNNNTNTNNGNITIEKDNDSNVGVVLVTVIILSVIILAGGVLGGCYIVSQRNHKNKK